MRRLFRSSDDYGVEAVSRLLGINTTLYEIIEAVMDEVAPEDYDLVTNVVIHLLGNVKASASPTV